MHQSENEQFYKKEYLKLLSEYDKLKEDEERHELKRFELLDKLDKLRESEEHYKQSYYETLSECNNLRYAEERADRLCNAWRVSAYLGGICTTMAWLANWEVYTIANYLIKYAIIIVGGLLISLPIACISGACSEFLFRCVDKRAERIIHLIITLLAPLFIIFLLNANHSN